MKNLKFERVNMKLVIIIAAIIIALLTTVFIIFRTNLIIEHKDKDEKDPVVENPGETTDPENPENPENPDNPENPENPENPDEPSNPGGTTEPEDPSIYDDPDENAISKEAKNRTKKVDKLTTAEKEYIIMENVSKKVAATNSLKKDCAGKHVVCKLDVEHYLTYSKDKNIGKEIKDCKGTVIFNYNENTKKTEFDLSELKCE